MDPLQPRANRSFVLFLLVIFCATLVAFTGLPSVGFTIIIVHVVHRITKSADPPM